MFYFVKTPGWLKYIYQECIWQMPETNKALYLSFDDGPHPRATEFVLEELDKFQAKATFFCIGKNVEMHKDLFGTIQHQGHAIGNHTHQHLNGWNTDDEVYLDDIARAQTIIPSTIFRPPYGRIRKSQLKKMQSRFPEMKTIMWSVLSGDFDPELKTPECTNNVLNNSGDGSIIVFHDSEKAFGKLKVALPEILKAFTDKGFSFKKIDV